MTTLISGAGRSYGMRFPALSLALNRTPHGPQEQRVDRGRGKRAVRSVHTLAYEHLRENRHGHAGIPRAREPIRVFAHGKTAVEQANLPEYALARDQRLHDEAWHRSV